MAPFEPFDVPCSLPAHTRDSVCSVEAVGEWIYIGTYTGLLQAWCGSSASRPRSGIRLSANQPVVQLQALPTVGLIVSVCGGAVTAHSLGGLRAVATLHEASATRFHCVEAQHDSAGMCVCSGLSLLWRYALSAPPRLLWSRMLLETTTAVHLGEVYAAVATASRCHVLCAKTGKTLQRLPLPCAASARAQPAWHAAGFVPTADPGMLHLIALGVTDAAEPGEASAEAAEAAVPRSVVVCLRDGAASCSSWLPAAASATAVGADGGLTGLVLLMGDELRRHPPEVHALDDRASVATDGAPSEAGVLSLPLPPPPPSAPTLSAPACVRVHGLCALVPWGSVLLRYRLLPSGEPLEVHGRHFSSGNSASFTHGRRAPFLRCTRCFWARGERCAARARRAKPTRARRSRSPPT